MYFGSENIAAAARVLEDNTRAAVSAAVEAVVFVSMVAVVVAAWGGEYSGIKVLVAIA